MLAEALSQILAPFLNKEKMLNSFNFLLRSCFEFEFHRLCLFRSILTGEIVKLHIAIGAKSKTKRYIPFTRLNSSIKVVSSCNWEGVETATIYYKMYTILIGNRHSSSSSVAVLNLVATKAFTSQTVT